MIQTAIVTATVIVIAIVVKTTAEIHAIAAADAEVPSEHKFNRASLKCGALFKKINNFLENT